ncbi:MAG: protein-L-isoaspartate(D-aspartate) O-methyltransferase, partial [Bacteriovoracaceae bacterium]
KKFGKDYWDGPRQYGYGGYSYDGRWKTVAEEMIKTYDLKDDAKILDVGCGKGFLLYEFTQLLPNCTVQGLDISQHAIDDAKPEVKEFIKLGHAKDLPFEDNSFDLIISNTTLHNLKINELYSAVSEITRVTAKDSWICVESYRNESEKVNLMYWQLTCESFYSPEEWLWIYEQNGYKGDYEFIYFE